MRGVLAGMLACALMAAPASALAPGRLLVIADEWSLTQSRMTVKSGAVIVELQNRGEDPHDLRFQRLDRFGKRVDRPLAVPEARSGQLSRVKLRLRAGRYRLYCSLPGHRRAGMRGSLRAR